MMVDQYHFGAVHRISPEAPVPVVKVDKTSVTLGGAGNVVNNIRHLGGSSVLLGFVGNDPNGALAARLLDELGIQSALVETPLPTTTKVRVIGEHQQIVRLDFEEVAVNTREYSELLLQRAADWIKKVDAIVISDYGKGVCDDGLCQGTIEMARSVGIPIIVDSKGDDWNKYRHATIVKPNVKEFGKALGREIQNDDIEIERYGLEALRQYQFDHLLVTRSEKGISLISAQETVHFHTEAKEVFDVSGAGDAVAATLALALAVGIDLQSSIELANQAAGIVVSKMGTAPVEYDELMFARYGYTHKMVGIDYIGTYAEKLRRHGKKIVLATGDFARLQKDHVRCLREAKRLGDVLIVAISKNPEPAARVSGLPTDYGDSLEIISALEFVDCVVAVDSRPDDVARLATPDVVAVIGDYPIGNLKDEFAKQVVVMPLTDRDAGDPARDQAIYA